MRVEGEDAQRWSAVRLDTLTSIEGAGRLMLADDVTGEVRWSDKTNESCAKNFGPHAIRIVRRLK